MTIRASDFDYKLLRGSHRFPGPDGGACLNEVAIVAAGLDYKAVKSWLDCPPCFSKPISAFVISLNDHLLDDARQRLKRFVLRLAGSASEPEMEQQRVDLMGTLLQERLVQPIVQALRQAYPNACRGPYSIYGREPNNREALAIEGNCLALKSSNRDLMDAMRCLITWPGIKGDEHVTMAASSYGAAAAEMVLGIRDDWRLASDPSLIDPVGICLDMLDRALAIGNQAPPIPDVEALTRLGTVFRRQDGGASTAAAVAPAMETADAA